MKKTLIVVDLQNDFVPGGALAVPCGDEVVPVATRLMPQYDLVIATQDWHPANHQSFASQHPGKSPGDLIQLAGIEQILWPDHCVQGTAGAEFVQALDTSKIHKIFHKGTDLEIDSYSGFFDNGHRKSTGLGEFLKEKEIRAIDIMGLATDYCVKFSVLDALELGLDVIVILAGCRGIDLNPGDCQKAIDEMERRGAVINAEIQ